MRKLSRGKSKQARGSDPELAEKVRELRGSLGIPQAKLAEMLEVSRSQVAEWETGGDESPSVEKLLGMARLASITELRRWLWIKAGVDLETLRRDFQEEVAFAVGSAAAASTFEVPIFDGKQFRNEDGRSSRESAERLLLPIELLPHPTSTICLRCGTCPPWSTSAGDLVVIDRAVTNPNALIGKMSAIFADLLPPRTGWVEGPRRSTWKEPVNWSETQRLKRADAMSPDAIRAKETLVQNAGLIVGRLDVQFESDDDSYIEPVNNNGRLILRLGVQASKKSHFVLSRWLDAEQLSMGFEPFINQHYQFIGEVVGWIKDPAKRSSK